MPPRQELSPRVGGQQALTLQFGRTNPPGGGPPSSLAPLTTPPRSLSQSIPGQFNLPQAPQQPQGAPGHQNRPHGFGTSSPYTTGIPPDNRAFQPPPTVDPIWPGGFGATSQPGPSGVRGMALPEGHSWYQIRPNQGEEIIVPIEKYHASKQANEKRQRNAGASARFRARKKDKELHQSNTIQKLETQNREVERRMHDFERRSHDLEGRNHDLERRNHDLEAERDRYRTERDRLRDLVHRTPGISELAYQGPPSPMSSRSGGGSFAERSPLVSAPHPLHPPMPMQPYGAADPSTGERASRRRRTDPQLDFNTSPYGQSPGTLPPMTNPTYTTPLSQPGTPLAAVRESRLAPLRIDPPMGTPTTAPSDTSTPTQSHPPYKREPYESGWATRPSGPPDSGQR